VLLSVRAVTHRYSDSYALKAEELAAQDEVLVGGAQKRARSDDLVPQSAEKKARAHPGS
jgi:hypothetical protein